MENIHVNQQIEFEEQMGIIANNNRHMAKWSLRELCLKAVVDQRELLINDSANLIEKLPVTVKSDLIKMTSDMLNGRADSFGDVNFALHVWCDFLGKLLDHGLTTIHIPRCFINCINSNSNKLIELLRDEVGSKCQKLRHLKAATETQEDVECMWIESDFYWLYFALPLLPRLQILELRHFNCNDLDLQVLATHAKSLVVLHVGYLCNQVSSIGIQALSKLPFLRKFTFTEVGYEWTPEEEESLVLCTQFLPQLVNVGIQFSKRFIFHKFDFWEDNCGIHIHNPIILQPVQLSLEEVLLKGEAQPHPKCQLPSLQRLLWDEPTGNILSFLDKYQTITELALSSADEKVVELVLLQMGQRLNKLVLEHVSLSLSKALMSCPHLEYVRFYYCQFKNVLDRSWCQNLFPCLKEADVKIARLLQIPRNFIKQLLSAPLLKKVRINDAYLSASETDELLELVRKKRILQDVDYFEWSSASAPLQPWMDVEDHIKRLLYTIHVTIPQIHIEYYDKIGED